MTVAKQKMLRYEDRRVERTMIGILTTPLGLLLGMGFFIAL